MNKNKIFGLALVLLIIFSCSGCGVHNTRQFKNYLKDLENTYDLNGKCEIISDTKGKDDSGQDYRTMKIQIKNTDITFEIYSVVVDTGIAHYELSDDYRESINEYYRKKLSYLFENDVINEYTRSSFEVNISTNEDYEKMISSLASIKKAIEQDAKKMGFKTPIQYYFHITFKEGNQKYGTLRKSTIKLTLKENGYGYDRRDDDDTIAPVIIEDIEKK